MQFEMPVYYPPDFNESRFALAPDVKAVACEMDGVAPEQYHSTSMYPEYFKINGVWKLAEESRMDCAVVIRDDGALDVVEMRNINAGDRVILGRTECCEEGVYLHAAGFDKAQRAAGAKSGDAGRAADGGCSGGDRSADQFVFRQGRSRETAFSMDYDNLYGLLTHERDNGSIVWVAGPAVAFDFDSRMAMQLLIENGFVHGLLAGNALATHDLEASYMRTALGQDIYTQESRHNGHYHHLDTINAVRRSGSIARFIEDNGISDGIICTIVKKGIPYVLTSSIRDDGPLPEVIHSAYDGQSAMRDVVRNATTIICLATQLHTIATGNMTPSFRVINGEVRPLFIYSIDLSEFATNKLADRGSLSAIGMVTNVQDFIVNVAKGVGAMKGES